MPCLHYIDDRWIGEWLGKAGDNLDVRRENALKSLYVVCEILTRVGYFINIDKSKFVPSTVIRFWGMLVDSDRMSFLVPEDKIERFLVLKDEILTKQEVDLNTLQKFAGKCISFLLAVPSAKFYTKEVNRAISMAGKNSGHVTISQGLRDGISHWTFLQCWKGCFPWRGVDNLACVQAWEKRTFKDLALNELMKDLFNFTVEFNVDLRLYYIHSKENPADSLSRTLSAQDCMLNRNKFLLIEKKFGLHQFDLMSLDSNVIQDKDGLPLCHFTPFPTPGSAGVNVFSQTLCPSDNLYVFPPFALVLPVLSYLRSQKVKFCTMAVPCDDVKPVWWPVLCNSLVDHFIIGKKEELNVLLLPSKKGFVCNKVGLKYDLWAARLSFD